MINVSQNICFSNIQKAFSEYLEKKVWVVSDVQNGKIPIDPRTGGKAKSNDPSTWGTFFEVTTFINNNPESYFLPALALSEELGITAIDYDSVIDPKDESVLHAAQQIINLTQSYTEYSQSGRGYHTIVKGKKPGEACRKALDISSEEKIKFSYEKKPGIQSHPEIEIYDKTHFITLTGNVLNGRTIVLSAQNFINDVYKDKLEKIERTDWTREKSPPMSDDEIIEKCRKAKNADKFAALFEMGDTSSYHGDDSAADFALASLLGFYTQNLEQLESIMQTSALKRPKWEEKRRETTYLRQSIQNALKSVTNIWQPTKDDSEEIPADSSWENPTRFENGEDLDLHFPLDKLPDVLRTAIEEISRYFHVDPALAALPGIGMAALQIGKKALIKEKEGLLHHPSFFLCAAAESGERKSSCYSALLDGIKDTIELETEDYIKEKAKVKAHNELIKEQVAYIKNELKKKTLNIENAKRDITNLYASEEKAPPEPFNFGEDLTSPRLFQKLYEHGGAYGVFSSDGRGIFNKILGKGNKNGESGEDLYIGGMWGDDLSRSRVGNNKNEIGGEDLLIRKAALTTVCFVQPDLWEEMAKDKRMRVSGLISRISLVIPKSQMGTRIETEDEIPLQQKFIKPFQEAVIRLRKWKPKTPVIVFLSKEAANRRRQFYNTIEIELGEGGNFEDVKDIATKATSLTARYALLFSLIETGSLNEMPETISPITEEQWLKAQALQEYFLAQAIDSQRVHSSTGNTHIFKKVVIWMKKQIIKNKANKEPLFILASQISKGVRNSKTKDIENKIIPSLINHGWLRPVGKVKGGKNKYEVNPKASGE